MDAAAIRCPSCGRFKNSREEWVSLGDRLRVSFVVRVLRVREEICPGCLEKVKNGLTEVVADIA